MRVIRSNIKPIQKISLVSLIGYIFFELIMTKHRYGYIYKNKKFLLHIAIISKSIFIVMANIVEII